MNIKNTIIEHYKKFFDLHAKGIALDEDDHLNIDWAEDLVKNCFIPNVVGRSEQLVCDEEIEKVAKGYDNSMSSMAESIWMPEGFKEGAKWMRKKLTGQ